MYCRLKAGEVELKVRKVQIKSILLVDDEVLLCENFKAFLEDYDYQVDVAHNGREGLEQFHRHSPDLVILDLHMPVLSGRELLGILHAECPDVPKLIISGVGILSEAMQALTVGGWDFLPKPVNDPNVLLHKIKLLEEKATLIRQNRLYQEHLEQLVEEKTANIRLLNDQLVETQKEIVSRLSDVIETRSDESGNHVRRVAEVSRLLARKLGLDSAESELIGMASPLHDIGKINIPDTVLNKQGRLTAEEFLQVKSHTTTGYQLLCDSPQPTIRAGAIIAHEHHEYWDGSGYPRGLAGDQIHIYGRITCLADVFDALRNKRHYKGAWGEAKTLDHIRTNAGVLFDPKLVDLFIANYAEVEQIYRTYPQPDEVI